MCRSNLCISQPIVIDVGYMGALINPRPGADDAEPVFSSIGGPPLPRKRAPTKRSANLAHG